MSKIIKPPMAVESDFDGIGYPTVFEMLDVALIPPDFPQDFIDKFRQAIISSAPRYPHTHTQSHREVYRESD